MNETLQYAIIAFILAGCIYFTVKSFRNRSRRGGSQCAGCTIKDACQSQGKTKSLTKTPAASITEKLQQGKKRTDRAKRLQGASVQKF